MANGRVGRRPGAGRNKKAMHGSPNLQSEQPTPTPEEALGQLLEAQAIEQITPEEFKKLAHKVVYMRQGLEPILNKFNPSQRFAII